MLKKQPNNIPLLNDELSSSFKGAYIQYYQSLCYFANKLIRDRQVAEDLVNEVFLSIWRQAHHHSQYYNIKAILYTSVKNACFNFIKQKKRNQLKDNELSYLLQGESEDFALNAIVQTEVVTAIYAELEKLPAECRTVMHLIYKEGWNNREIASYLGIAESTVRNQKFRGLKVLKNKFGIFSLLLLLSM